MKCKYCGKELYEGSKFCGYCGKQQPMAKYCINCGREIGLDDTFCGYCGTSQNGVPPTSEVSSNGQDGLLKSQAVIQEPDTVDSPKYLNDASGEHTTVEEQTSMTSNVVEIEETVEEDKMENVLTEEEHGDNTMQEAGLVDETKTNNTTKYVLIACLALLVCCVCGYLFYSKTSNRAIMPDDAYNEAVASVELESVAKESEFQDISEKDVGHERVDDSENDNLSLEVFTCIVDSVRGRLGPGEEYDEDEDWWSNIERGDNVWYLNTIKNGYYECLIRGFRGTPCVIWIPEDCLESTGKIEETYFSNRDIKECNNDRQVAVSNMDNGNKNELKRTLTIMGESAYLMSEDEIKEELIGNYYWQDDIPFARNSLGFYINGNNLIMINEFVKTVHDALNTSNINGTIPIKAEYEKGNWYKLEQQRNGLTIYCYVGCELNIEVLVYSNAAYVGNKVVHKEKDPNRFVMVYTDNQGSWGYKSKSGQFSFTKDKRLPIKKIH